MIWLVLAGCGSDCPDNDGDGAVSACPGVEVLDCDDNDATVRPGGSELCDGLDNDCDGDIDEGLSLTYYLDADGDGYGDAATEACEAPSGHVRVGGDCDDSDPTLSPGAEEVCDGYDNDCDGGIDDGAGAQEWYADNDNDGYPGTEDVVTACDPPSGYYAAPDVWDCDDSDPEFSPDAKEFCDEQDNDCDGEIDENAEDAVTWYEDNDGDGYGGDVAIEGAGCTPTEGYSLNSDDCDDTRSGVTTVFAAPLDGDAVVLDVEDMADICPCYTAIDGTLRVRKVSDSTDLSGLSCLEEVGGLVISNNDGLVSLEGLNALESIDDFMTISDNDQLEDLDGLSGLEEIGGIVNIQSNPALADLSGLSSLTTITGTLTLSGNDTLTGLSLGAIESVGSLSLDDCGALETLSGMPELTTVRGEVRAEACSTLTSVNLPAVSNIGGDLYLYNNANLSEVYLPELTTVGGELRLHWVAGVTDLDGMSSLLNVGEDLVLWGNATLSDVSGMYSIEYVGGSLTISNNPDLSTEDAEALQDAIGTDNISGSVTISNNSG